MQKFAGMCFNWKVVGGLIGVGLGVVVLAPTLIAPILPLLLLAACPLSMLGMLWAMHAGPGGTGVPAPPTTLPAPGESHPLTLADLTAQRAVLQAHQDQIARAIATLESAPAPAAEPPATTGAHGAVHGQIVR